MMLIATTYIRYKQTDSSLKKLSQYKSYNFVSKFKLKKEIARSHFDFIIFVIKLTLCTSTSINLSRVISARKSP